MQNTLLNLTPGAYSPEVHLSQYDKGRTIPFKLMDGNAEYTVPSGAVIKVKATKPSGLGFVVDCTYDGGTVTITNTETMSNEAGRFPAELSISVGDVLLGTANFIFNVERSPHPEGTTDGDAETLLPELTLLVKEIRESNAKVESMTASATALSSDANPTANYNSETNNLAFGIPTPDVTKSELLNLYITKSASGSIASFSDGADDVPLKSLKVQIVPNQSGSGDPSPSNVRPISGWDSVNVYVSPTQNAEDGTSYPISLGQTVYGGTLEVMSGKLTISYTYKDLGSMSWAKAWGQNTIFTTTLTDGKYGTNLFCSNYVTLTQGSLADKDNALFFKNTFYGDHALAIRDDRYTNATAFKTAMNGVQLVYELATPTEIQLTPTEVKTLLGANNIWADSGDSEAEYRADSTLAYEELSNAIISLGGNI